MDIKEAVNIIDEAPCFPGSAQQREAWQTLKTAVLAQQTPNSESVKSLCDGCGNQLDEANNVTICSDCFNMISE